MWVQLREALNTGRYDGRPWPPPFTDWEVPDWEGERMIRSGLGMQVAGPPPPAPAPPAPEPVATIPEMVSQPSSTGQPEPVPPPPSPPAEPELPEPAPNDSKQSWVDYAVNQGASPGEAATMTKAQLMQAYGGRL